MFNGKTLEISMGFQRWNTLVMDFTGFHVWRWAIQWNFIMNNGDFMRFNDWTWGFSEPTTLGRPVNARRQTPSGFSLLMAARRCLCQDFINLYVSTDCQAATRGGSFTPAARNSKIKHRHGTTCVMMQLPEDMTNAFHVQSESMFVCVLPT